MMLENPPCAVIWVSSRRLSSRRSAMLPVGWVVSMARIRCGTEAISIVVFLNAQSFGEGSAVHCPWDLWCLLLGVLALAHWRQGDALRDRHWFHHQFLRSARHRIVRS